MKKKIGVVLIVVLMLLSLVGCTAQQRAKKYGGSYTIELPVNEKLSMITWKDSDLWYVTKPMTDEDVAETYKFQEDSTWGILEGVITIVESKTE